MESWFLLHPVHKVCRFLVCKLNLISFAGRLVRVVLVAVVCDKPATHKISGFGSHEHTNFCTYCWISQADKDKARTFMKDGKSLLFDSLFGYLSVQHSRLVWTSDIGNLGKNIAIYPI